MSTPQPYSMMIAWSAEDRTYLVTLPEWAALARMPITHGGTYLEAAPRGRHALESLIEQAVEDGKPLPTPAAVRQGVA